MKVSGDGTIEGLTFTTDASINELLRAISREIRDGLNAHGDIDPLDILSSIRFRIEDYLEKQPCQPS